MPWTSKKRLPIKKKDGYEYDGCLMRRRVIKHIRSNEPVPGLTEPCQFATDIPGVEFVTQLHVSFVVLIYRPEGMRIQYLKVGGLRDNSSMGNMVNGKMDFPPMRWDNASMRPVHFKECEMPAANSVKYVFTFNQSHNSARCATRTVQQPEAVIEIFLRDPANRVLSLQIASCRESECPSSVREIRIANFCGQFVCDYPLNVAALAPVLCKVRKDFGAVFALFCTRGHITIYKDLRTCALRGVNDWAYVQKSLAKISGGAGTLSCFLLVLLGCLGFNLNVSHFDSLLEHTIQLRYAHILATSARTEETSNKLEVCMRVCVYVCVCVGFDNVTPESHGSQFSGAYSLEVLDKIGSVLPAAAQDSVLKLKHDHVQDAKIDVSISRLGEVIFRLSFAPYVVFTPPTHAWAKMVCKLYTEFFGEILDGGGWVV
jgi:hypothetical protein